jgi:hypothetical protein
MRSRDLSLLLLLNSIRTGIQQRCDVHLDKLSSTTVPPMFFVCLNILSSATFSTELSTYIVFGGVEVSRRRTLESGRPIQDINLSRLLNVHALHTRYVEDM